MIASLYPCFKHWDNQTIWIYSDPHFNDSGLEIGINRPTAEEQIKSINSCVGKKDTLIILGDIGDIECAKRLRGYKVLVKGNHDAGSKNFEGVFDEVYAGPLFITEKILLTHEPVTIPFIFNIHGHDHSKQATDAFHLNVCSDVIGYKPINLNQFMKSGALAKVLSVHRQTINKATKNSRRRRT